MPKRMGPLSKVDHEEKKWLAFELSLRKNNDQEIARALKIHYHTVAALIKEAFQETQAERVAQGLAALERAVAEQEATIKAMWRQKTPLHQISMAYERLHKLQGLLIEKTELSGEAGFELRYVGVPPPQSS